MNRELLLLTFALFCGGCGPEAAVLLRIEAPLRVPDECDGLKVTAIRTSDGENVYEAEHALSENFPLDLLLTTENADNVGERRIEIRAEAKKGGALAKPWSTATVRVDLASGRTESTRVQICDCPVPTP